MELSDPKAYEPQGHGICGYDMWVFTTGDTKFRIDGAGGCGESTEPSKGYLQVLINDEEKLSLPCLWPDRRSTTGGQGARIPPAAYFVSNAVGSNYLDGILFVGAAFLGAIVSGFVRGRLAYALCMIALPLNTCLAVYLYYAHQWVPHNTSALAVVVR